MNSTNITVEAAIAFAKELGLSDTDVGTVKNAMLEVTSMISIAVLFLQLLYPTLVYTAKDTPGHYILEKSWNWSLRAQLPATAIFSPGSAEAVSVGLKVLTFFSTPFAIRSGGHTPFEGSASIADGILISTENLNTLSVNNSSSTALVGPGNRWIQVYRYLEPYGLAVVGGRVPPVGCGGLLLGGGNSYFSAEYGLPADNVRSYQVVLADSSIVTASAKENSDLFWALKGGSNNFGIVTLFELETIAITDGQVYGGSFFYTENKIDEVLVAIEEFLEKGVIEDPKAAVLPTLIITLGGVVKGAQVTIFHKDTDEPAVLSPWKKIGAASGEAKMQSLSNVAISAYGGIDGSDSTGVQRTDFRTLTIGVSPSLFKRISDHFFEVYGPYAAQIGIASLTYQSQSENIQKQGEAKGGNPLGLPTVSTVWLCLTMMWESELKDELVLGLGKTFLETVSGFAKEEGLLHDYLFLNDAAKDQEVIKSYGEENVKKLRQISSAYDSNGVFQTLSSGGFKLPTV